MIRASGRVKLGGGQSGIYLWVCVYVCVWGGGWCPAHEWMSEESPPPHWAVICWNKAPLFVFIFNQIIPVGLPALFKQNTNHVSSLHEQTGFSLDPTPAGVSSCLNQKQESWEADDGTCTALLGRWLHWNAPNFLEETQEEQVSSSLIGWSETCTGPIDKSINFVCCVPEWKTNDLIWFCFERWGQKTHIYFFLQSKFVVLANHT